MGIKRLIIGLLRRTSKIWPDQLYIKCYYYICTGHVLNLNNPKTFSEKLNWMKLNYRRNDLFRYVDKYEAKKIVENCLGSNQSVIPAYGVYDNFNQIDFDALPDKFILKCTHDSGTYAICKDKRTFDKFTVRNRLNKGLRRNYFYNSREWPYKYAKPRIVADMLLDDQSGHELRDYKFWCFDGVPRVMYCTNKAKDVYENFYDMEFNILPISHGFRRNVPEFDKPAEFELMKKMASKLSQGLPFVRIDFFDVNGHVYFGEFTFYDWGGNNRVIPEEWEMKLGDWITLPKKINPYK